MLPPKDEFDKFQSEQKKRFKKADAPAQPPVFEGFGPPDFGDEKPSYLREDDIENTYAAFEESQTEPELEPLIDDDDEETNWDDEEGFEPPPAWEGVQDYPTPPSMKQPNNSFLTDDQIFPGGPTRSEVNSWKKQFEIEGHTIHLTEVGSEYFIWRTMNRTEYRELMAIPNTDPLQREEIICEICMLYPYNYNFTSMAYRKAGVPAILAEQIMHESGFKKPSPPMRL